MKRRTWLFITRKKKSTEEEEVEEEEEEEAETEEAEKKEKWKEEHRPCKLALLAPWRRRGRRSHRTGENRRLSRLRAR
jgi:hypothetical protein